MNRKILRVIYIVNIIIIISILAYLIYTGFNKYNGNKNKPENYVQFNGYQLKLTTDLESENEDGAFLIHNLKEGWNARIIIMNDPNNAIFSNDTKVEEILRYKGYDVSDLFISKIDNQKYITLKMNMGEEATISSVLFGYYKPNDKHICEIMINDAADGTKLRYDAFEQVVKIFKSAKYDSVEDENYQYHTLILDKTLEELYGNQEEPTE